MIASSIRARIQLWHTFLLASLVGGLLVAFYFHEKRIRETEIDSELSSKLVDFMPHYASPHRTARSGTNQGERRDPPPRQLDRGSDFPYGGPRQRGGSSSGGPSRERGFPPMGSDGRRPPPPDGFGHPQHYGPPQQRNTSQNYNQPQRPGPSGPNSISSPVRLETIKNQLVESGSYVIAIGPMGNETDRTENAPKGWSPPEIPPESEDESFTRTRNGNREYIYVARRGTIIAIGRTVLEMNRGLHILKLQLAAIWFVLIVIAFTVGWILVSRSLRPIQQISSTASNIAHGDLSQRIDNSDTDSELGQLVEVLNETFEKLDASFNQQVRFTADASHELRTPISVILAKCQFALRKDRDSEKYRQTLVECERSAQHIRKLVESLLQLARADSGELKINQTSNDLGTCLIECTRSLGPLAEEKNITLHIDCPMTIGVFDKERIEQVITNLVSNAIKYTPEGGEIRISTEDSENWASFSVRDNGQGIEPEKLPNLFDRFFRANTDQANEHRSTGLGLAIVKSIVDAHEGEIEVSSQIGQGSTFRVSLPKTELTS